MVFNVCVLFVRTIWGIINSPYETCRTLASGKHVLQLIPLYLVIGSYFIWSALVHHGISAGTLGIAALITHILIVGALYYIGKHIGGRGSILSILMPWSYSLIPTVLWFYSISLLWLLFPPPRTVSVAGQVLSLLVVMLSLFLLYWKIVLYYLTLRFGMKLDMKQILRVSIIMLPIMCLYAWGMYKLGMFRVPFF